MRRFNTIVVASLIVCALPRFARTAEPKPLQSQSRKQDNSRPDQWTKELKSRAERGTLHDAFQNVRGDSGKWSDEYDLQRAPPITHKPEKMQLDDWFDQLSERRNRPDVNNDHWLLLRTRQMDDNDRQWIERVERRGKEFTIVLSEAVWQGKYRKNFTYYNVFGVNLGKLGPGKYQAKCIIRPLTFREFDGDGRPRGNQPKDERPANKKPVEVSVEFVIPARRDAGAAAKTPP